MRDLFAHRPTTPSACALGVAFPLTPEEFARGLRAGTSDFARMKRDERGAAGYSSAEKLWTFTCSGTARRITDVVKEVKKLGVRVVCRCRLADLPGLFEREVVTLVAHWRSWRVLPRDLRDVPALARRLAEPRDPVAARVREWLAPGLLDRIEPDRPPGGRRDDPLSVALAQALNAVIDDGLDPKALSGGTLLRRTRRRSELGRELGDLIEPGNQIELADGLHPVDAIIEAIPESFSGIVDLTVCNSVALGEAIKRKRPDCLIVMNLQPTNFDLRVVVYRHLIRYLSRTKKNYLDAVAALRIGVLHEGSIEP